MSAKVELSELAINGGPKVRTKAFPDRGMLGIEEKAAVDALFDQAIATGAAIGYNGPEEEAYGKEFAEFMGGGYADGVNSGTNAVYVALRALNPEPFTEIICPPITDPGGVMPVVMLNCIPVIADAAPGSFNAGPEQVEELISPLTSAILVAHIGGEPADIEGIAAVAKKHNIPLVEDCAQAHYTKLNGKLVGSFGDVAAFSTMFGKHHCTGGQGGVVFTKNEDIYWNIRRSADRGKPFNMEAGNTNPFASLNMNLNELQAAIGRQQLKKLPGIVDRRRNVAAKLAEGFKGLKSITIPELVPGSEPSYWFWRLKFNAENMNCDKNTFCAAIAAEGIQIGADYSHMPQVYAWYQNRRVFGTSGYPWSAPEYKGDPNRKFECPNVFAAVADQFILFVLESWGDEEVADILAAFKKVESAYAK